jgi:hypothetical protein
MCNVDSTTLLIRVVYVGVKLSKQEVDNKFRTNESGLKIREGEGLALKVKGKAHALSSTQKR